MVTEEQLSWRRWQKELTEEVDRNKELTEAEGDRRTTWQKEMTEGVDRKNVLEEEGVNRSRGW